MDRSDKAFVLVMILALAAAIFLGVGRARIEDGNKTVEVIVDADEVRQVAAASGLPILDVLAQLREAGATALAVRELTVGELADLGSVLTVASAEGTGFISPDGEFLSLLATGIHAKLPRATVALVRSEIPTMVVAAMSLDQLAGVPVLLRVEDLRAAGEADLRVVGRLVNFPAASPEAIEAAVAEAAAAGVGLVVFGEDQVLGFQDLLPETAEALTRNGLIYGHIEMVDQKGGDALARRMPSRLVRVHSITDADMLTMAPAVAIPRYVRAVEERNVRACYVRLVLRPDPDLLGTNVGYVRGVTGALRSKGFGIGPPAPFAGPEGWPPRWARAVALLALPAALVLLLRRIAPLGAGWAWVVFFLVIGGGGTLGLRRPDQAASLAGLAAACVFPTLAVVWAMQWARGRRARLSLGSAIGRGLLGLLLASAVSSVGAMTIVAAFSPVSHLAGVGRFAGVKLAYVGPLLGVFVVMVCDLRTRGEAPKEWWARVRLRAMQFVRRPVTAADAFVVLVALGAVAYAVTRSGNQPALAPSGMELRLRDLLESLLVVRPRTKEFLLGHPALMLAVALSLRGRPTWLPAVAVLAAVGQVSLVNTFCHFHTPLHIGLLRTANGLWLGALVGAATIVLWRLLFDRRGRPSGP